MTHAPVRAPCLAAALVLLGAGGCHRALAPEPAASLAGLVLPLATPGLALAVEGEVQGRAARVELDVARLLSTATPDCLAAERPEEVGSVHVPAPAGGVQVWRLVRLEGARLGGVGLGPRLVGLAGGAPGCRVTLGADVLAPYALEVDPVRREVALRPSRPLSAYRAQAGAQVHVLELARDPRGDWPLLAARLVQGEGAFVAPFVLGTREAVSRLAASVVAREGLRPGEDGRRVALDALELAGGVGQGPALLHVDEAWSSAGAVGLLAPQVWGRFHAVLDVQGGVLLLRRPPAPAGEEAPPGRAPAPPAREREPEDPPAAQ